VLHIASRRTYGVSRIHAELRRLRRRMNRKRIARVMRERDIRGLTGRRAYRAHSCVRPSTARTAQAPLADPAGQEGQCCDRKSCFGNALTECFRARSRRRSATRTWPDRTTARAEVFNFIESFSDHRRLRKHKTFGYLTFDRDQTAASTHPRGMTMSVQDHGETSDQAHPAPAYIRRTCHALNWSRWRRRHQATARRFHHRRRTRSHDLPPPDGTSSEYTLEHAPDQQE
jgi:hypothetical protein